LKVFKHFIYEITSLKKLPLIKSLLVMELHNITHGLVIKFDVTPN